MSNRTPVVRQFSWRQSIPQLLILAGVILVSAFVLKNSMSTIPAIMLGAGIYLLYSQGSRYLILSAHRHGIQLVSRHKYNEAIKQFEKSYDFFNRFSWIDNYRSVILLSSSAMAYKEMALLNIAFCYGQSDQGDKAKEYYKRVLDEYPDNGMAIATLKLIDSVKGDIPEQP